MHIYICAREGGGGQGKAPKGACARGPPSRERERHEAAHEPTMFWKHKSPTSNWNACANPPPPKKKQPRTMHHICVEFCVHVVVTRRRGGPGGASCQAGAGRGTRETKAAFLQSEGGRGFVFVIKWQREPSQEAGRNGRLRVFCLRERAVGGGGFAKRRMMMMLLQVAAAAAAAAAS